MNPVGMSLDEIMVELYMLCAARGAKSPSVALLLPRSVVASLYKDKEFFNNDYNCFNITSPIGDSISHFDRKLDMGDLGSCRVLMKENFSLIRRIGRHNVFQGAVHLLETLCQLMETKVLVSGVPDGNGTIAPNPLVIRYRIEEIKKQIVDLAKIDEVMNYEDDGSDPRPNPFPDYNPV